MGATYNDAQKRASVKYLAEKTDSIQIRVPKGKKDKYKLFAASRGRSLNSLICMLIEEEMRKGIEERKIITEYKFTKAELDITVIIREYPTYNDVSCKILYHDKRRRTSHDEIPEEILNKKDIFNNDHSIKKDDIEKMALDKIADINMSVSYSLNQ